MPRAELVGLAKGIGALDPWVRQAFVQKEKERQMKQKFVSDYYMDLLKRGELGVEEEPIVGPMAGPVPTEGPLAGYLRPPTPTREPVPEEAFDIMGALAEGRELPSGVRRVPTKIPKGLEPFQYTTPGGVTYRVPTKSTKSKTDPRFSELMSLSGRHFQAYKTALDMGDEEGIALYAKRFDTTVGQAEDVWRASNPDIPLPRFTLEELAKDPNAWQKFWGTAPKKKVIEVPPGKMKVRVKTTGQTGTIDEKEFNPAIYERL